MLNQSSAIKISNSLLLDKSFKLNFERFFEPLKTLVQHVLDEPNRELREKEMLNLLEMLYFQVA